MLPNGGFPPIEKCEYKETLDKKKDNKKVDKGFFYTKSNNINIRDILKKNSNKKTLNPREDDDDLEVIE